jgi:hypothetical protein
MSRGAGHAVQAWRVGDERAETYLRLLAEAVLRQAGGRLRALDAAAGTDVWSDPGMAPFATSESATWKVGRAARILVAAGVLDQDVLAGFGSDLHGAISARSRLLLNWDRRRGMLGRTMFAPSSRPPASGPASQAMRVTPIGRSVRMAHGRGPSALHLMSLVLTETEAVITVVMRMHRPPPTAGTGWGITHQLPYDQLWAVDELGARYTVRFEGGVSKTNTWRGIARLIPVPPLGARRLDLVGDETHLVQIALRTSAARGYPAAPPVTEPVAVPLGERLLVLAAERVLAGEDPRGPVPRPEPGEIITVLTETGAIAADSVVPGQLAAVCQRLGTSGHGITVPAAKQIPAPWASVIAQRDAPRPAGGPEVFAPLAVVLPDLDGARFALAGLSMAAGESHLHVVSSGMPRLAKWFAYNWTPGFSWWVRDDAGNWHVAMAGEPCTSGDGLQAFQLRLTPPLAAIPDAAEVVVTGPATRVRATVPVRPANRRSYRLVVGGCVG